MRFLKTLSFLALLVALPLTLPAWGHPMPSSEVALRFQHASIDAELTLPVTELALGWGRPLPDDAVQTVRQEGAALKGYVAAHVHPTAPDGRPWTVRVNTVTPLAGQPPDVRVGLTMTPPPGAPADRLNFGYDVIFHHLITHTAIVTVASDWQHGVVEGKPVLLGTMRDTCSTLLVDRTGGSWVQGFSAMFWLGVHHIAEGTDHLLFLLALLLPAPLAAAGKRWGGYVGTKIAVRQIIKVVTAFTLGHSVTLALGVVGWVHLPGMFVEAAIALSIFVSALHALVPIFRGKEVFIAGGFGLVHGMAFAATLTGFGFDAWMLVSSVLGFNLGIEACQIVIILAVMPWFVLLARSTVYPPFRVIGGTLTAVAAASWFMERAFGWRNPVAPVVESIASHAFELLFGLVLLAVGVAFAQRRHGSVSFEQAFERKL